MSAEKYIKIPEPVLPLPGAPFYSLKEMVTFVVDNEPRFQIPASNARMGVRVLEAFDKAEADVVVLRDTDHKFLAEIMENPSCGYASWFLTDKTTGKSEKILVPTHRYLSLIDAIDQATNSDPRAKAA
jgi:hypothetical protein